MKPYIYKVTDKVTGEFYIGSQCRGKVIGKNYFTSSTNKSFKEKLKSNPAQFEIKIIGTFTDPYSCILQENIFIKNCIKNPFCLNKSYKIGREHMFSMCGVLGKNNPNFGSHRTEESKKKMSAVQKGRKSHKKGKTQEYNRKKIICLETQVIYSSAKDAGVANNICPSYITKCAKHKRRIANKLHWEYYDESKNYKTLLEEILKSQKPRQCFITRKKIICVETQVIYGCSKEAADTVNVSRSNITSCARHKQKTAGGFHWEYADSHIPTP